MAIPVEPPGAEASLAGRVYALEAWQEYAKKQLNVLYGFREPSKESIQPQADPTTPEELRQRILVGLDRGIASRFFHLLSTDDQRLVNAQREYWSTTNLYALSSLLQIIQKEPK